MFYSTSIWFVVWAVLAWWVLGAIWYSPVLFAKQWRAELKLKEGSGMAMSAMLTSVAMIAIVTLVLAYFIHVTGTKTWMRGAYLGAKLWLVWGALTYLNSAFQGGSKKLFAIDGGYHLVGIVLAGAILVH